MEPGNVQEHGGYLFQQSYQHIILNQLFSLYNNTIELIDRIIELSKVLPIKKRKRKKEIHPACHSKENGKHESYL